MKLKLSFICIFVLCFSINLGIERKGNKITGNKRKRDESKEINPTPQTRASTSKIQKGIKLRSSLEEGEEEEELINPVPYTMELRSKNKKCQKRKKNNIEEKEEYETAICPVEKGKKDDIFGKGDNQLDDPILTSLKKNKKFELYYCSAITRWKFIKTLQCTNENSFYDSLEALMKENKKVENMGNTGIIGIKAPEDTQINFYQYSRNIGSKKVQHSENDIFKEILNNGVKEKSEIILSSYYCPCPSCIGGLFDYSLSHKGITIKMYCFTFMSFKKYPSLGQFVKGKKYYNMCKGVTAFNKD